MKLTAVRLSIAASLMLAAVTTASAEGMKAEIPFRFHVAGALMQPGTYHVTWSRGAAGAVLIQIRNVEQKRSALVQPKAQQYRADPAGAAQMSFLCTDGECVLSGMTTADNQYGFWTGKTRPETRIATVVLTPDRAD